MNNASTCHILLYGSGFEEPYCLCRQKLFRWILLSISWKCYRLRSWKLLSSPIYRTIIVPTRLLLSDTFSKSGLLIKKVLPAWINCSGVMSSRILLHQFVLDQRVYVACLLPCRIYRSQCLPCWIALPRPCNLSGLWTWKLLSFGRNSGHRLPHRILLPDPCLKNQVRCWHLLPRRVYCRHSLSPRFLLPQPEVPRALQPGVLLPCRINGECALPRRQLLSEPGGQRRLRSGKLLPVRRHRACAVPRRVLLPDPGPHPAVPLGSLLPGRLHCGQGLPGRPLLRAAERDRAVPRRKLLPAGLDRRGAVPAGDAVGPAGDRLQPMLRRALLPQPRHVPRHGAPLPSRFLLPRRGERPNALPRWEPLLHRLVGPRAVPLRHLLPRQLGFVQAVPGRLLLPGAGQQVDRLPRWLLLPPGVLRPHAVPVRHLLRGRRRRPVTVRRGELLPGQFNA